VLDWTIAIVHGKKSKERAGVRSNKVSWLKENKLSQLRQEVVR